MECVIKVPDDVVDVYQTGAGYRTGCEMLSNYSRTQCEFFWRILSGQTQDEELDEFTVKQAKSLQKARDVNRIERKAFRETARRDNALKELYTEVARLLKEHKLTKSWKVHKIEKQGERTGIIQISDTHFNELIDLDCNTYNFTVGSQRLAKLASEATAIFKAQGIKKVIVMMTGDLLNSDRRLDEMLAKATNRAKAAFLTVDLFQMFLRDLNQHFNLGVIAVAGNESRIKDEVSFVEDGVTDNYDWIVFNMLKKLFEDNPDVVFTKGNPSECVFTIHGRNFLALHGHSLPTGSGVEKSIQQLIGRYASRGITVDYVFCGHFHSARIGDFYARSSSLAGSNSYSEYGLNLLGKASQNVFVVSNSDIHGTRVDLQSVSGVEGYPIDKSLAAYNIKSDAKLGSSETIVKVVI